MSSELCGGTQAKTQALRLYWLAHLWGPQLVLGRLMQSWVTAALLGALRSLGDALLTHLGTTPSSFTLSPLAFHPSNILGQLPSTRHTPSASCPTQAIQNTFPDERQANSSFVPHTPTKTRGPDLQLETLQTKAHTRLIKLTIKVKNYRIPENHTDTQAGVEEM